MAQKRTSKRSTKKATKKAAKTTKRKKAASKKPKREPKIEYQLTEKDLFELKMRLLELEKLDVQVSDIIRRKLAPQIEVARAEARDEVEGWHEAQAKVVEVQQRLQKTYGKPGYVLADPDGETGKGFLVRKS